MMRFSLRSVNSSISKLVRPNGQSQQKLCLQLTVECFRDDHIKIDNTLIICSDDYYKKNNLEQDYDTRVTCSINLAPQSFDSKIEPGINTDYAILVDGNLSINIFLKDELFFQFSHHLSSYQGLNDLFVSFASYPVLNNFSYQQSGDVQVGIWKTIDHQVGNQLQIENFEFSCRLYERSEQMNSTDPRLSLTEVTQ